MSTMSDDRDLFAAPAPSGVGRGGTLLALSIPADGGRFRVALYRLDARGGGFATWTVRPDGVCIEGDYRMDEATARDDYAFRVAQESRRVYGVTA